ncbi:MAG: GyrI-like domain-containing protein [bacterium]|nr:GyrI-like domain-containing protein [bacterium]
MKKIIILTCMLMVLSAVVLFSGDKKSEPVVKELENFRLVVMDYKGSFNQMNKNASSFMGEFFKQNLVPAGPFTGVYYNSPEKVKENELIWSIGFPIQKDNKFKEPLKDKEFPKGEAIFFTHTGPYEKMESSYNVVFKYIKTKGYKIKYPTFERYLNNPQEVKPEELKTLIIIPINKKK